MAGTFIVLEGGEGGGKSTQVKLLREKFPNFVFTKEPGGTPYADKIRALILDPLAKDASGRVLFGLLMASRFDHVENVIAPSLKGGKTLISDRYISSSYVYQLAASGCMDLVPAFEEFLKLIPTPDLIIVLEIDPAIGLTRVAGSRVVDHLEDRGIEFHKRVRQAYHEYAERYAKRKTIFIDASQSIETIHQQICATITSVLGAS